MLNERARAARNAYWRQWTKENRDKVRAQQERYWERKADKMEAKKANEEKTEQ